jgi:hypothetical protein
MRLYASAAVISLAILSPMALSVLAAPIDAPRVEIGPQITQTYLPVSPVGSVQYQPSVGGVASIRLGR